MSKLLWVTCPECATNFQISGPDGAQGARPTGYWTSGIGDIKQRCPNCKHRFFVKYY